MNKLLLFVVFSLFFTSNIIAQNNAVAKSDSTKKSLKNFEIYARYMFFLSGELGVAYNPNKYIRLFAGYARHTGILPGGGSEYTTVLDNLNVGKLGVQVNFSKKPFHCFAQGVLWAALGSYEVETRQSRICTVNNGKIEATGLDVGLGMEWQVDSHLKLAMLVSSSVLSQATYKDFTAYAYPSSIPDGKYPVNSTPRKAGAFPLIYPLSFSFGYMF